MTEVGFDPTRIFQILDEHEVDHVVIGAMAAMLQSTGLAATLDVDIMPARDEANRARLAAALKEMDARLRVPDPEEAVPIPLDARMLASASVMTFVTRHGPFDVLFEPSGAPPYEELRARSAEISRFGVSLRVADVRDVIAMKRAAGREKDAAHVATLLEFLKRNRPSNEERKGYAG